MRKADVQLNYHNDGRGHGAPMLNVRVDYLTDAQWQALAATVETDTGMEGVATWLAAQPDADDATNWAIDAACEDGATHATELAGEVFGERYGTTEHRERKVWQTGRSGGWLYVEGLPDVESWDAIMLGKWSRFAKGCAEIVAGIPYDALTLLAINTYDRECQAFADAEALAETIAADAYGELVHG